jgi:hypothetical protein
MNKVPLLQSRRFWLMLVDIVTSTVLFLVTGYFTIDPKTVDLIKYLIGALQPVIIAVIIAYTADDTVKAVLDHKMAVVQLQQTNTPAVQNVSSGTPSDQSN